VSELRTAGVYASEREFEEKVVEPILRHWRCKFEYQKPCRVCVGTQYYRPRLDYLVSDERGLLTLFENKLRIVNEKERQAALDQARSYALLLRVPTFVIASPECMSLYRLNRSEAELIESVDGDELTDLAATERLKNRILRERS
jgi:hypothetical protein